MTSDELYNMIKSSNDPYHINIDAFNTQHLPKIQFQVLVTRLILEGKLKSFNEYDEYGNLLTYYSII